MYAPNRARFWAAFCLINLAVVPRLGYSTELPATELFVYLSADPSQSPRPLNYMKLELGRLMSTAGYRVEWRDARVSKRESTAGDLVFVEMRGICGIPVGSAAEEFYSQPKLTSFATTAVSEGRILPFSSINCANITQALAAPLAAEPGARRDFLYGRAVARVLAHELYHVLLRTSDHAQEGVARASFTASDLLTEHFEFEQSTLARLRREPESVSHLSGEVVSR